MREANIIIEPYQFIDLLELHIQKKVNQHATVKIVGHISEELEDKYAEMTRSNEWITIKALDEEETNILFKGLIKTVAVKTENQVRTLEIEAISGSYLMDIHEKTCTFQNEKQTYGSIMNTVKNRYGDGSGVFMTVGEKSQTGTIIVQYRETDWNFAKRLASHFNSYLVPEYAIDGAKIYFGRPNKNELEHIKAIAYSIKKDVGEYMNKTEYKVKEIRENDALYYCVQSREIYDLCIPVEFKNRKLYIYEINSRLEAGEIMHYYTLKSEGGFKFKKEYNEKLIGASLDARILDITKDIVKVHILVDAKQDVSIAKWFPYSTVYSSPDGTGWYCMPEKGDTVRVYFPDEKEKNAFVISAVHKETSHAGRRSDPSVKCLSTKYGKHIILSPGAIEIKNSDDLYIKLFDDGGIEIYSDKDIKMFAKENIEITSEEAEITMQAGESVNLKQGETTVVIEENITFNGGQVRLQEEN
ncbi:Phage late control gene D protein (GPD) [Anaerovirgula multivorans]|uniref:Phage late control gene D protein (GPD) n=1 Tax=Anaerovirgula multivorans TaxID=312168 RepID=A0A239C502_9FIRM|nr:phage baseplate assembly protein V [Anaerovirgula multivorans]SNS15327.1 Phage late control gene D protein (GPD) [Anaerovirgula multivorans]